MNLNNYWKSLKGHNAIGFIGNTNAYTDSATYGAFVDEAAEGEIGVFILGASGVEADAVDKADAIAAGDEVFIAQKLGDSIRKTPSFKFSEIETLRQDDFLAPVAMQAFVGYDSLTADDSLKDLNSVALAAGISYQLILKDMKIGNEPYPTWYYDVDFKSGDLKYDMLHRLCLQINDLTSHQNTVKTRIAEADIVAEEAETDFADTITVANGSTLVTIGGVHSLVIGDFAKLGGVIYKIVDVPTTATLTIDRPFTGASVSTLAATTANWGSLAAAVLTDVDKIGLRLTAQGGKIMAISVLGDLENADITYAVNHVEGRGTSAQAKELERSYNFFDGHTAQNTERADSYGSVPSLVVSGETYDTLLIKINKSGRSTAIPNTQDAGIGSIIAIITPAGAGPTAALKTVLPAI